MNKVRCPICESALDGHGSKEWPDWPFCSKRCRLVDLGRWLGGAYSIETSATPDDSDSEGELAHSPKPAGPSADPDREEA